MKLEDLMDMEIPDRAFVKLFVSEKRFGHLGRGRVLSIVQRYN